MKRQQRRAAGPAPLRASTRLSQNQSDIRSFAVTPAKRPSTEGPEDEEALNKKAKIESHNDNQDDSTTTPKSEDPSESGNTASNIKSISQRKKIQASKGSRPPPQGVPPVWALLRGDLTETLDYFRQRQSGTQTNDGSFRGSLLASDYGQRPYLDDELVLTRAGGGMEFFATNGGKTMRQGKNQDPNGSTVKAFLSNMAKLIACPIILSEDCQNCPSEPQYPYMVLSHFKPVFHWFEKDNGHLVSRFRWEKLNLHEKSWWVPKGYPQRSGPPDYTTKAARQVCSVPECEKLQPIIFAQGFVCLEHKCKDFWKLDGKVLTNGDQLSYNPEWLAERIEWPAEIRPPFALRPQPLPLSGAQRDPTFATMRAAYKGIVCPCCGCCLARQKIEGWFCETVGCRYEYLLPPININIKTITDAFAGQFDGHAVPSFEIKPPVQLRDVVFLQPWRIQTYGLAGLPGCLLKQFHSNAAINSRPGGADEILAQMANPALQLKRRVMFQAIVDGTRTNHFLSNFGLPYRFSADVPSMAFSQAPPIVMNALHKMIWAGEIASEGAPLDHLNEVLILGYFQDQAIGYHDDGEGWLGQTIVTFSLGSNATMTIRMKAKYYYGATGNNVKTYDPRQPIIDGCVAPTHRQYMNENWTRWTKVQQAAEFTRLKKMQQGVGIKPPVCFKTTLAHGDYIVMQGDGLQKYFEHQISNDGRLRYALTARHVRPETVNAAELYKGDYVTTDKDIYSGDMDAFAQFDQERADADRAWTHPESAATQLVKTKAD
ncbi:MAG: hypothetical protein LQ352_007068 [Teloschistes flavicans]|nr:MAG: hypothetical protein LQ352_007068 [Teloschistes flavicans]